MVSQQQEQQEQPQNQQQVQVSDLIRLTQWMNDMLTPPRAQRSIRVAPGAPNREGRQDQDVNADDNDDDDAIPDLVEDEQEEQQEGLNDDARNRIARAYPRRVVRRLNFDAPALDAMQARLQRSIFGEIEGSLFGSFRNE
jgi:hypothetical protein